MIEWLDEFYNDPDLRETTIRNFLPVFTEYVKAAVGPVAEPFVQSLAESYVDRHLGSSRAQLQEVIKDADDPLAAITERFDEWQEKRPEKVANNELVRSANAASLQQMRESGVTRKVWRTVGTCPFCKEMAGRTTTIEKDFVKPGDALHPEGVEVAMTVTQPIGHPPLHQGCVCSIEPAERYASFGQMPKSVRDAYDLARGYDPVQGDRQLRVLTDAQGFTGKPLVLTDAELDALIAKGEIEFWRGVTKESYAERWLYGNDVRHGTGYYGNGTYSAVGRGLEPPAWRKAQGYGSFEAKEVAETFAFNDGVVMRGTIRSDARVLSVRTQGTDMPDLDDVFTNLTDAERAMDSVTHVAAARGYDAVLVEGAERIGGEIGGDQLIILNRGAIRMSSTVTATRPAAVIREEVRARA